MNHIILIGNLVADPELRTTVSGKSVCNFRIAVRKRLGAGRQESDQPDADFFSIIAWNGIAENCGRFLSKGKKVCVVGSISMRKFEGRDGTTRYSMEVNASEVEFLTSPSSGDQPAPMPNSPAQNAPAHGTTPAVYVDPDEGEELPF